MQICPDHWQRMRDKIDSLGLSHLVAKSGEEFLADTIVSLDSPPDAPTPDEHWDPLACMMWNFYTRYLEVAGLSAMHPSAEPCPLCAARDGYAASDTTLVGDDHWIDGCSAAMLAEARRRGLVPETQ